MSPRGQRGFGRVARAAENGGKGKKKREKLSFDLFFSSSRALRSLVNSPPPSPSLSLSLPPFCSTSRSQNQRPTKRNSYALDVNLASLDVLNHKRLLDSARADPSAVSFQVRPVDVALSTATAASGGSSSGLLLRPSSMGRERSSGGGNGSGGGLDRAPSFSASDSLLAEAAAAGARAARPRAPAARPAFGSSPNLQALVLEAEAADARPEAAFYEVTIASVDQPKLLSRLSEALVSVVSFFLSFAFFFYFETEQEKQNSLFSLSFLSFFALQPPLKNSKPGRPQPQHLRGARLQHARPLLARRLRRQRLGRRDGG